MRAKRTCGGKIRDPVAPEERRMCPALATRDDGLCDAHRAEYEALRGNSAKRGYGSKHRKVRRAMLPSAYGRPCPVCGQVMLRSDDLEAEHSNPLVADPTSVADRIVHRECNPRGGAGTRT